MWVGELGRLLASLEADIRKLPPFEPRFSLNNQRQEITALTAEVQSIIIAANARVASPDSIARMSILCVSFQLFGSHDYLDSFNDRHMSLSHSLSLTHSIGRLDMIRTSTNRHSSQATGRRSVQA